MTTYRFYIKDNEINFILSLDDYDTSDECNSAASLVNNGYDSYLDKQADHPMWELQNGELIELDPSVVYQANPGTDPNV